MARSAILSVRILGDARSAVSAMRDTASESGRLSGALGKIGGAMAVGATAVAAGAGAMAVGLHKAVGAASALQQAQGGIDAVFQGNADAMHAMAASAATNVGLTKTEFSELGTLIGSQLKNGGTAMDELAPKTSNLIGVGADLAAMFGGTTADAVSALSASLKGERDPIERYGVSLTQAAVDAKAAELGFTKVGASLSAEANQAATLALIMEQTTAAHGAFGRESNTLAGQLERARAGWGNVVSTVGTAFLPVMTQGATLLNTTVLPALQGLADRAGTAVPAAVQSMSAAVAPVWTELTGGVTAFATAWTYADGEITSSGFPGYMEQAAYTIQTGMMIGRAAVEQFAAGWSGATQGVISSGLMGFFAQLGAAARDTFTILGSIVTPAVAAMGGSLQSAGGTLLAFAQTFSPVQLAVQALLPSFPVLGAIIGTVAATVLQLMGAVVPLGAQLAGVLVPVVSQVALTVFPALLTVLQIASGALLGLVPHLVTLGGGFVNLAAAVLPLAAQIVSVLIPPVLQLATAVLPLVVSAVGAVVPVLVGLASILGSVLAPTVSALLPVVQTVFSVAVSVITAAMTVLTGIVRTASGVLQGDWSLAWSGMTQILSGAGQLLVSILTGAGQLLVSIVRGTGELIAGIFTALWDNVTSWASTAWADFVGIVERGAGDALGIIGSIPGRVRDAFAGAGQWLLGSGRALVDGFASGIRNAIGGAVNAARDVVSRVRDFFPFSPAKKGPFSGSGYVTHSGKALGRDFAGSILSQAGTVARATGTMLQAAARKRPKLGAPVQVPLAVVGGTASRVPTPPAAAPSRGPAPVININIETGVGDPVEIGREVDRVLRRYREVMGV